jgi:proteasome lid subunit RPN8/RPN11
MRASVEAWTLAPSTAESLLLLARASTEELCGLIYGNRVVVVLNIAAEPANSFKMDPEQLRRVQLRNRGHTPDAIWHSHPGNSPWPSGEDLDELPDEIPSVIVCPDGRIGVWLNGVSVSST